MCACNILTLIIYNEGIWTATTYLRIVSSLQADKTSHSPPPPQECRKHQYYTATLKWTRCKAALERIYYIFLRVYVYTRLQIYARKRRLRSLRHAAGKLDGLLRMFLSLFSLSYIHFFH